MANELSVTRVGALVRGIGPEECRERLRAWRDADHRQYMSDQEIEAEVKRRRG